MRLSYLSLRFATLFCLAACTNVPDANTLHDHLNDGEAQFIVRMDGEAFYPDDSRFRGEVTVTSQTIRLNLVDQYESNVIISLDSQDLFAHRPVQRTIDLQQQTAGSVLIGRVRDRAKRTGDGFLMSGGTLTIESLSEARVVIRLMGKTGNFNTLHDRSTHKRLEGLLVYRKPTVTIPAATKKTLLY